MKVLLWIGLALLVLVGVILIIPTPEATFEEGAITTDSYCAPEQSDARILYSAIGRGDMATALGMVERGNAFAVEAGDRAVKVYTDGPLLRVRLVTGRRAGERCWTLVNLVR